jgi:hypothetical protein
LDKLIHPITQLIEALQAANPSFADLEGDLNSPYRNGRQEKTSEPELDRQIRPRYAPS